MKGLQGVGFAPNFAYARAAQERGAARRLTLALSRKGLTRVGLAAWERGRPAGGAALTRGAPSS